MKLIAIKTTLIASLILLLAGCSALTQRPEVPQLSLIGFEPVTMGLLEQRYKVSLRVKNVNQFPLPIKGLNFAMEINGIKFGSGVSNKGVTVPGLGEGVLDFEVTSNIFKTFQQFRGLGAEAFKTFDYKIKGSLALINSAFSLPFDVSDSYSLFTDEKPSGKGI
ncbi:MAG: LEA type 2 family protein [Gammaproteobacteria bacterium]